jgi:tRNA(Ile)-lysidine synthase
VSRSHPPSLRTLVERLARDEGLFARGEIVLCACSGGPDSTALVLALHELAPPLSLGLCLHHVDHGLRPGSAADGERVQELGARLGLAVRRTTLVVPEGPGGLQERARTARYAALEAAADELGCARIAVGHTRSDQAETVLHRLLRGAGVEGLGAIPPVRGRVVRPLLDVSRAEVLAFLGERGQTYVEDPSNERTEFLRVALRRDVLPRLEAIVPGVEERLAALAAESRATHEALETLLAPWAVPSVAAVRAAPPGARSLVVRQLLRALRGDLRGLGRAHIEAAVGLVDNAPDRGEVHLPGGAFVREGDQLRWDATRGRGSRRAVS